MSFRRVATDRRFFGGVQPWLILLGACHPGDDVVAIQEGGIEVPDVSVPTVDAPSLDTANEPDAGPPISMDAAPPTPDVMVEVGVPPPVDSSLPPGCEAPGPTVQIQRISGEKTESCAGQLAAHTFTHALCACEDLNVGTSLSTGSFDSTATDTSVVLAGAPVGLAGNFVRTGWENIGGSLTVAGTARAFFTNGGFDVQGDLRLAGSLTFTPHVTVARDAWFVSPVGYFGYARIGRNLYTAVPSGSIQGAGTPLLVGGSAISTSFTVDDPCRCSSRLDVAAMTTAGSARNDNALRMVDPTALVNVTTTAKIDLPCGRFRFDSIGGTGSIQLTILGRTAIFVDGSVTASDAFQLVIAPGAEVDWFIRDNLTLGAAKLGDSDRPSATRIYVGGSSEIALTSGSISANIYAPNANVGISANGVSGSVYGKSLTVSGAFIRYDRAILNQGVKCEQPATCDHCNTCNGGKACLDNACTDCRDDADCCLPLVCNAGACVPLLDP